MSYCTIERMYLLAAPERAFGQVSRDVQQASLDAWAAKIDSKMRGRYPDAVPLLPPIDPGIERANAVLAAYDIIAGIKGAQPSGIDIENLKSRAEAEMAYLDRIQRQAEHPAVTPPSNGAPAQRALPRVSSGVPRGI